MRSKIIGLLVCSLTFSTAFADDTYNYNGDGKYCCETYDYKESQRLGKTAEESSSNAINLSMFGWGVGLAAGIAILAAILHQSKASTAHE